MENLKENILEYISTNNIKDLKLWLLSLPKIQKIEANNIIITLGQQSMYGVFANDNYPALQNFRETAFELGKMYLDEKELYEKLDDFRYKNKFIELASMYLYSEKKKFIIYLSESKETFGTEAKALINDFMDFEMKHDLFDADSWIVD